MSATALMPEYRKIKVGYGQTVADLAIQYYGCIEAGIKLIQDNLALFTSIEQILKPGTVLKIQTPVPVITATNVAIANEYAVNNIKAATGSKYVPPVGQITTEDGFNIITEGVGGVPILNEVPTITDEMGNVLITESNQQLGG